MRYCTFIFSMSCSIASVTSYLSGIEAKNLQHGDIHIAQIPDFEMKYLENHLAHWGRWWLVFLHFSRSFIWAKLFFDRRFPLRDQISQEILIGIVIFLCLSKIYLPSFTWSKLHFKSQDETVSIISWIFHILAILLRTSLVNSVIGLALLVWQRNYHVQTVHLQKIIELYSTAIFGSFTIPNEQR